MMTHLKFEHRRGQSRLTRSDNQGFSLVELLVVMVIAGIVLASIYSAYYSQQKSYHTQDQVAAMQQNLRVGMEMMVAEIRMAGYDPKGSAGAGILDMGWDGALNRYTSLNFTMDINENGTTGDSNENITYCLYTPSDGIQKLGRKSTAAATNQPVAEHIDALDFVYLDGSGAPASVVSAVRSIQVTMVARGERGDPGYTNTKSYLNQQGTVIYPAANDSFRRKRLTVEVQCRNLGL
jgi:type IV pilus assembly protein PilW